MERLVNLSTLPILAHGMLLGCANNHTANCNAAAQSTATRNAVRKEAVSRRVRVYGLPRRDQRPNMEGTVTYKSGVGGVSARWLWRVCRGVTPRWKSRGFRPLLRQAHTTARRRDKPCRGG